MIGLEDRQALARDIAAAHAAGARLRPACEVAGIELRTLQRWKAQAGLTQGDGRPQAVRPVPSHAPLRSPFIKRQRWRSKPQKRLVFNVSMKRDTGARLFSEEGISTSRETSMAITEERGKWGVQSRRWAAKKQDLERST